MNPAHCQTAPQLQATVPDAGAAIEAFVAATEYVPPEAHPVSDAVSLPIALWSLCCRESGSLAWRAWRAGGRCWFIQGRVLGTMAGGPVIHLAFRDPSGRVAASGVWHHELPVQWQLLAAFDPECD